MTLLFFRLVCALEKLLKLIFRKLKCSFSVITSGGNDYTSETKMRDRKNAETNTNFPSNMFEFRSCVCVCVFISECWERKSATNCNCTRWTWNWSSTNVIHLSSHIHVEQNDKVRHFYMRDLRSKKKHHFPIAKVSKLSSKQFRCCLPCLALHRSFWFGWLVLMYFRIRLESLPSNSMKSL